MRSRVKTSSLRFLLLRWNNIIKRNLGRVHFSLQFHITSSFLREVRAGTQIRQEPGSKNGWRGHRGVLLYWLALHDLFHLFSLAPRTTSSGVAPVSWVHLHYYKAAQRSIQWGHFFNCHSLFQNHSRLCQLDIKLGSTHHVLRNSCKTNHSKHVTIVCLSHNIKVPAVRKKYEVLPQKACPWKALLGTTAGSLNLSSLFLLDIVSTCFDNVISTCGYSFIWKSHPRPCSAWKSIKNSSWLS